MRCGEWIVKLNELAPESCACEWDNPGLLAGRMDKEIGRVLVALDATDQVVELAVQERADLLLTHHPLIFRPIKRVNDRDITGRRLIRLIRHDICCYAMHTNFDAAPGCMADLAAARLRLLDGVPLQVMGEMGGEAYGIGKVGLLPEPVTIRELAEQVKRAFDLPYVAVYGARQTAGPVQRAAVCPGSGKGMAAEAKKAGAQVLITGDIGHHDGIDAAADGVAVIDAGHYGLEHIFVDFMAGYCAERIDGKAVIRKAPLMFPAEVW